MTRIWLKLVLFLVPAVAATIFVLWRLSPEQAIIRRAEVIFTSVEKKTLDSGSASEKAEQLRAILDPEFSVNAPLPIPSGPLAPAEAAEMVREFLLSLTSCAVTRSEERVTFPSPERAIYEATLQVDVAVGRNTRHVFRYLCQLEFVRREADWLLQRAVLTAI